MLTTAELLPSFQDIRGQPLLAGLWQCSPEWLCQCHWGAVLDVHLCLPPLGGLLEEACVIPSSILALCPACPGTVLGHLCLPAALGTAGGGSSPEESRVLEGCVRLVFREKHEAAACSTVIPKLLPVRAKFLWLLKKGQDFKGSW